MLGYRRTAVFCAVAVMAGFPLGVGVDAASVARAEPESDLMLEWVPDNHCDTHFEPIHVHSGFLEWGARQACHGASVYTQYLRVELQSEVSDSDKWATLYVANSPLEQRFTAHSLFTHTLLCKSDEEQTYRLEVWSFADDERQRTHGLSPPIEVPCEL